MIFLFYAAPLLKREGELTLTPGIAGMVNQQLFEGTAPISFDYWPFWLELLGAEVQPHLAALPYTHATKAPLRK